MAESSIQQHPASQRFQNSIAEYEAYLPLTQCVQEDLKNDAEELRAQEGWDESEWTGIEEWVNDMDSIFRHLRRHRFEEGKTMAALLTTLQQRITLSLHLPIPSFPPYTDSPLFFILPLPEHTDRLGRPIAILTVKEVIRDTDGKLDDLKTYAWWALEVVRRTLRDYWIKGKWSKNKGLGKGGEGLCLVVDAQGAGYRNMEVELLPTLLSVGHNNFPGMIESVYVVNTGWTHRSMWNVIKRVLPKSALEKVAFLDNKLDLEAIFDLDKLPKLYGGNHSYTFSPTHNPTYTYYSHHSSIDHPFLASRNSSYSSIADIYYSAPNTPARSRRNSSAVNLPGWKLGHRLRMTKSREASTPPEVLRQQCEEEEGEEIPQIEVEDPTPIGDDPSSSSQIPTKPSLSRKSSTKSNSSNIDNKLNGSGSGHKTSITNGQSQSAIQRIKSLSDFHLYLSPSRLAHLDLLSDSDSDSDYDQEPEENVELEVPTPIPRKTLQPALFDDNDKSLSERRLRPPLRLLGVTGKEGIQNVRSYSDRLQQHHAKVLQQYTGGGNTPSKLGHSVTSHGTPQNEDLDDMPIQVDTTDQYPSNETGPSTPGALEPPSLKSHLTEATMNGGNENQSIHEYDNNNPWFGYPVIRVTKGKQSSLKPKYSRNRKRDLIKTLLFLFMLRLQSLRNSIERYLGLTYILNKRNDNICNGGINGPSEGLLASVTGREVQIRNNNLEKDWWWMIIGFLLLRGTWSRLLVGPLETIGWGKEILGWFSEDHIGLFIAATQSSHDPSYFITKPPSADSKNTNEVQSEDTTKVVRSTLNDWDKKIEQLGQDRSQGSSGSTTQGGSTQT